MEKVSVIIPTYNRFKFLLETIKSVQSQTYKNIEIVIVNDCSTNEEYYNHKFDSNIIVINNRKNSKNIFGYGCPGYIRNLGIQHATGDYIAFCDDDDIWFSTKIEDQLNEMKSHKCDMSSTEGLIGNGMYKEGEVYKKYNKDYYFKRIKEIYKKKNSNLMDNGYPKIWDSKFIKIHNCIITSSVLIKKSIINLVGDMGFERRGQDYEYWKKILNNTNSVYVDKPLFYYNKEHGYGSNH